MSLTAHCLLSPSHEAMREIKYSTANKGIPFDTKEIGRVIIKGCYTLFNKKGVTIKNFEVEEIPLTVFTQKIMDCIHNS